ncbi:hypothetical protein [Nocardioides sp. R-C-SC26]|uniref:hypothetical protein n=1 Tax=Nocardioides sp. R-C-SC26 TaxID=2870414 RepID=UPI001E5E218F|nr:hypothetical protein [Nocardioides sp. R-C-SC26]
MSSALALVEPRTVYRLGKRRVQHDWSVHVVGDDTVGYSVQVRTRCGVVLSKNADAQRVMGFVTCPSCEVEA